MSDEDDENDPHCRSAASKSRSPGDADEAKAKKDAADKTAKASERLSEERINDMKVPELKAELARRDLSTDGKKAALCMRLIQAAVKGA